MPTTQQARAARAQPVRAGSAVSPTAGKGTEGANLQGAESAWKAAAGVPSPLAPVQCVAENSPPSQPTTTPMTMMRASGWRSTMSEKRGSWKEKSGGGEAECRSPQTSPLACCRHKGKTTPSPSPAALLRRGSLPVLSVKLAPPKMQTLMCCSKNVMPKSCLTNGRPRNGTVKRGTLVITKTDAMDAGKTAEMVMPLALQRALDWEDWVLNFSPQVVVIFPPATTHTDVARHVIQRKGARWRRTHRSSRPSRRLSPAPLTMGAEGFASLGAMTVWVRVWVWGDIRTEEMDSSAEMFSHKTSHPSPTTPPTATTITAPPFSTTPTPTPHPRPRGTGLFPSRVKVPWGPAVTRSNHPCTAQGTGTERSEGHRGPSTAAETGRAAVTMMMTFPS